MKDNIFSHILNSTGELDHLIEKFNSAFHKAKKIIIEQLNADQIDIMLITSNRTIKDQGISGYAPGPHHLYVRVDPKFKDITEENMILTILHETHHCMRIRKYGIPDNLAEGLVSEGLATLYEEEHSGSVPIYAQVKITQKEIDLANKSLRDDNYDRTRWFFGDDNLPLWFGYSYGYKLAKEYSEKTNKKASELVHVSAKLVLP
jgi:uncharacterized protein YjaZ